MASSNMLDDQASDVEGWEIANGHQPSPEFGQERPMGPNCPDLVLKTHQVNKEMTQNDSLICPVCLNSFKFLKNLGCNCNACMSCAETMLIQWQDGDVQEEGSHQRTRLCTTCDQEHVVQTIVHKSLKPVFGPRALKCMSCHNRKDTQDGWWCQDCSSILCSKCAHKSHRDHATVEFDQDYDAIRFCCSMLQTESQDTATRFKTMTWSKFEEIFKVLEAAIDQELETQNKQRRVRLTEIFGHASTGQYSTDSGCERIYKRLSAMQKKAKQQFPNVLDEILSLAGLGSKESIKLKTDVVAEKVVQLLKEAINELSADDFKFMTPHSSTPEQEQEPEPEVHSKIMQIEECPPSTETKEKDDRHY